MLKKFRVTNRNQKVKFRLKKSKEDINLKA